MSRTEFTIKTKMAAWKRANGICECGCGVPFGKHKDKAHYDHITPDYLGGDNSLENCACIRWSCHIEKTRVEDTPRIAKARRGKKKNIMGITKASSFQSAKTGRFKKKLNGTVVDRKTGEPI